MGRERWSYVYHGRGQLQRGSGARTTAPQLLLLEVNDRYSSGQLRRTKMSTGSDDDFHDARSASESADQSETAALQLAPRADAEEQAPAAGGARRPIRTALLVEDEIRSLEDLDRERPEAG